MYDILVLGAGTIDSRRFQHGFDTVKLHRRTIWNTTLASSTLPFSASRIPRPFAANRSLPLFCSAL